MFLQRVGRVQISITQRVSKSVSLRVKKYIDKGTLMEIPQALWTFNSLTIGGCYETVLFRYLSDHTFYISQSLISEIHNLRGSSFFSKCWKFDVDSRNIVKYWEKAFTVLDNCFLIGCFKFSLLRREYLSSVIKELTKYLKGYNITNRDIFSISSSSSDQKIW